MYRKRFLVSLVESYVLPAYFLFSLSLRIFQTIHGTGTNSFQPHWTSQRREVSLRSRSLKVKCAQIECEHSLALIYKLTAIRKVKCNMWYGIPFSFTEILDGS